MDTRIETIPIPNTSANITAYFVRPAGDGPFPGIVVIHEAFGLNDNIKDITRRLAAEGYAALAVDLFAGRNMAICMLRFFSGMFLNPLNHTAIHDLKAALTWLENHPDVDSNRLGAIGFCMGGGFAVSWACTDPRLHVIAPFYALNPRPLDAVARSCPVVGSYPENDFTKGMGKKLDAELARHNIPRDIKIYPDSKHSFFNDQRGNYNAEASADAWGRTLAFFKQHIGA
ncbi:MAG: dienelactone hydrolase family protein [Anaerolineae bacterium]|nr:dienelactone hydrolase family protein [Anaerolineae bacterium]